MADNFEENVKKIMDDHPDFPVNEQMFAGILGQLASDKTKRRKVPMLFWFLLLLLGFLLSSFLAGFFYYKQKNTAKALADFKNTSAAERKILKDTINEKKLTILFDTIYQTYTLASTKSQKNNQSSKNSYYSLSLNQPYTNFPFSVQLGHTFYTDNSKITPSSIQNYRYSRKIYSPFNLVYGEGFSITAKTYHTVPKIDKLLVTKLAFENESPLLENIKNLSNKDNKTWFEKTWDEVLTFRDKSAFFLKPKHFALAIPVGKFKQLNLAPYKGNSSWEIQAEVGLNNNLSWVIGTAYLSTSFGQLFNDIDVNTLDNFPTISPNSSSDKLHEIYGQFGYIQIPIGLKYSFLKASKVRPYIGVGFVPSLPVKSNLKYEFLSPAEYYLEKTAVLSSTFALADYWTSVGTYYSYNNTWRFGIEGSFQKSFKKGIYKYQNRQFLKWALGIQYKF